MKWDQFCHKQEKGNCVLYYSYSIVNKTNTSEESAWRFSLYDIRKQLMFHVNIFPGTFIEVPITVLKLCSLSATRVDIYRLTRDFHNNVSLHCLLNQNTLYGGKKNQYILSIQSIYIVAINILIQCFIDCIQYRVYRLEFHYKIVFQ